MCVCVCVCYLCVCQKNVYADKCVLLRVFAQALQAEQRVEAAAAAHTAALAAATAKHDAALAEKRAAAVRLQVHTHCACARFSLFIDDLAQCVPNEGCVCWSWTHCVLASNAVRNET